MQSFAERLGRRDAGRRRHGESVRLRPTYSPATFGHDGAGGQIGWGDPATTTGISIGYCANGFDRNEIRHKAAAA